MKSSQEEEAETADLAHKAFWEDDKEYTSSYNLGYGEAQEAAFAEAGVAEEGTTCYVCLEEGTGSDPLLRGCACRGSAGYGHMGCFVESAEKDETALRWSKCPTCRQYYTGPIQVGLAEARVAHAQAKGQSIDLHAVFSQGQAKLDNGDTAGAVACLQKVLAISRMTHGADVMSHMSGASTALNLAAALERMGKYDEASALLEEVIDGAKNSADHECRESAHGAKSSLGAIYCNQGEFQKALPLLEEALVYLRNNGNDEGVLVQAMHTLGNCHSSLGNHRQAITLCEESLKTSQRIFGPAHPLTRAMASGLENVKEWAINPDKDQLQRDLRSRNASQAPEATVIGLTSRPELNGRRVKVGSHLQGKDRYRIFIEPTKGGEERRVEEAEINAANLILEPNARVVLRGLVKARDKNGETGVIQRFDKDKGRYVIALDSREVAILAKPDNARLI